MKRLAALAAAALVAAAVPWVARAADGEAPIEAATPRAVCGAGSNPETGMQGRVSADDQASGRAAKGYTCNAAQVGHYGSTGGFRVHRYVDAAGRECAYYDSTLLFPTSIPKAQADLTGVYVLDMTDPAHPVKTDNLMTPAMLSPHESLSLNQKRGLLAANMGGPFTMPGFVDVYDLTKDCRHPVLQASVPFGILGHEGNFSPDGNTYWVTSTSAGTIVALDVKNPATPTPVWTSFDYRIHGINISDDGNRFYGAALGSGGPADGLTTLDVSQVQARVPNPTVKKISHLSWADISIPQTGIPVTIGGHAYNVEVDEFAGGPLPTTDPTAHVGAGRIIDMADETHPRVVSEFRLEVHQPGNRARLTSDPGADSVVQGYAGHYCNVPQRTDPGIVACSYILSGLRVFDIRDPLHPKELAYFNAPPGLGSGVKASDFAMSGPTFVPARSEVWYADGNSGFYVVRLTNGVWPFPATASSAPVPSKVLAAHQTRTAPAPTGAGRLPSTGGSPAWSLAGLFAVLGAALAGRASRLSPTPR
jgi:hypothetical protein